MSDKKKNILKRVKTYMIKLGLIIGTAVICNIEKIIEHCAEIELDIIINNIAETFMQ